MCARIGVRLSSPTRDDLAPSTSMRTLASRPREAAQTHGAGPQRLPTPARSALPWVVLLVLLGAASVLFFHVTRGTTLTFDEWEWALYRRGNSLGTFLDPHNGHFSLVPVLIYKLLFATAGLRDYTPYRAVAIAAHLGCVILLFVYARRRVPDAVALLAAALILFLGPAWQNFLWPFQVAWLISIGAGLGALLLLDRHDRAGNAGACALLMVSLASSGVGIAVVIGAAVDVLARRDRWRRSWIVVGPLVLYGIWWIGYQNTQAASGGVARAPGFIAKAASATMAALAGLAGHTVPIGSGTLLDYGPPLAGLGLLVLLWVLTRPGRASPRVFALMALTFSFWLLIAIGRASLNEPFSSRYLYVGAFFVVVLAVELARGIDPSPVLELVGAIVVCVVIASNVRVFSDAGSFERLIAKITAADLAALDIGRPAVKPGYVTTRFPGYGLTLNADAYYATAKAIGSPAATPAELQRYPETLKETADSELMSIHGVRLLPASASAIAGLPPTLALARGGSVTRHGPCLRFAARSSLALAGAIEIALPASGVRIATGGLTTVSVRRFASAFQPVAKLPDGGTRTLRIGPDLSPVVWHVLVSPTGSASICTLR